jgi:hypothetical protein
MLTRWVSWSLSSGQPKAGPGGSTHPQTDLPDGKSVQFCSMSFRATASPAKKSRARKPQFAQAVQRDLGRPVPI